MNVVPREKQTKSKDPLETKKCFTRKDFSQGIRGASALFSLKSLNTAASQRPIVTIPKYKFNNEEPQARSKRQTMGPPPELPKAIRRKIVTSSSLKPDSSSSGKATTSKTKSDRLIVEDTTQEFSTPKNRPTTLRYISSSSRGATRSARSTSTSVVEPTVILAISEGRGMARGEIGMAAIDLKHPHLVLCQFSDSLLYTHALTKINYFHPVEIIVPHTFCEGVQQSKLYQLIRDQYPQLNLNTVQRRYFNDADGRQQIQTLCSPQYSSVYLEVVQKFYALTAAAAVLKYVEYIQCIVFARESLKIEYHSSENTMIIDVGTATQLELVQPLVLSAGPTCCLLGILGPTFTTGGIRALRAAILQPSCKREYIEARLDSVQEIKDNDSGLMVGLQDVIKKLPDVDKILLLCVDYPNQNMDKMGEAQLNQTLLLKTTMDVIPKLVEALNVAESGRLKKIKMDLEIPDYGEIAKRIHNVLLEDAHMEKGAMGSLQRCFAVKPEINGLLDVARRTYSELIEDIQKIVEELGKNYDLPLRMHQNVMKGFHIVMPVTARTRKNFIIEDLPPIFIQVQNSGASVSMTTEELVVLDNQAKEALNEIQKMSNVVISSLLKDLRPFMSSLYKLCENVAELDILLALAQVSTVGSYIRPEFDTYVDVKNSVHPLLDYNSQVMPVPNDFYASPEHNFTIVTGPNMGGKSIYIKQIAILHIMAQLGCYVPATSAVLRLCDRLFSRIGFNDSVELNASTYVLEMKEIHHTLKVLTPNSLVIIDELCRGTSTEEGASVAWAVCEELLLSDAFTFFTTHFRYLTRLQELYYNVVNVHTKVKEEISNNQDSRRLVYEHRIEPGVTKVDHYGLALASKTNLREETVALAVELAGLIAKDRKNQNQSEQEETEDRLLYNLNADIRKKARRQGNLEGNMQHILNAFKNSHPDIIRTLQKQRGDRNNYTTDSSKVLSKTDAQKPKEHTALPDSVTNSSSDLNPNNKYDHMPPVTISTSDEATTYVNCSREERCPAIKSSNELLNTIIENNFDANNILHVMDTNDTIEHETINNTEAQNTTDVNITNNEINEEVHLKENININNTNKYATNNNIFNCPLDIESDDTVILNRSTSNKYSELSDNDVISTISLTSDDYELMKSTAEEITFELNATGMNNIYGISMITDSSSIEHQVQDAILTPPIDFMD